MPNSSALKSDKYLKINRGTISPKELVKIGQAAKALGVSIDTLRRWEKAGKIKTVRTPGGTRLYHLSTLEKINPSSVVDLQAKSLSTEELLRKTEDRTIDDGGWKADSEDRNWRMDNLSSTVHFQNTTIHPLSSIINKILVSFAIVSVFILLITSWITVSYLANPKEAQQFFKHNIASGILSPFNLLAKEAVSVIDPQRLKDLDFNPPASERGKPDEPPPLRKEYAQLINPSVLAVTASSQFLEVNSDTQINGNLDVRDCINGLNLQATPSATAVASGCTRLTVSKSATIDQDLSTTTSPTFNTLNLSGTSNQIVLQSGGPTGTLTWTPTTNQTITFPNATGNVVLDTAAQTLTNKTINGSNNTITNIPNSALSNSTITINTGTGLAGGGSVSLGGSISLSSTVTSSISSVSNTDGTLTISPTTGAVVASLNLSNANTWTAAQTFSGNVGIGASASIGSVLTLTGYNCSGLGNGGKLTTDISGNVTCSADTGSGATALTLSSITAATTSNNINNADFAQAWNWQLTTADKTGFTFGENAASTATGTPAILSASTLAGSTATPLYIKNYGNGYSFRVDDVAGDTTPFVIDNAGNVGIGTSAPSFQLQTTDNVGIGGSLTVTSAGIFGSIQNNGPLVVSGTSYLNILNATDINSATLTTTGNVGIGGSLTATGLGVFNGGINVTGLTNLSSVNAQSINTTAFRMPTGASNNAFLVSDASGNASWTASLPGGFITNNSLDFSQFKDNMTLDASTDIATAGFNLTTSGTGNVAFNNTGTFMVAGPVTFTSTINTNTFTSTALTFSGSGNVGIGASIPNTNLNLNPGPGGLVNIAGGSGSTGCTIDDNTGTLTCTGSIGVGSSSGQSGLWDRTGSTLSPAFSGDNVTTSGNISTTGTGTITSGGTLTAQNGFTLSTGALNMTSTSGTANLNLSLVTNAFDINGSLFSIDTFNNRVGIGTTAPTSALNVIGNVGIGTSAAGTNLAVNGNGAFGWGTTSIAGPTNGLTVSGNVGIGTTTANSTLALYSAAGPQISFNDGAVSGYVGIDNAGPALDIATNNAYPVRIETNGSERLRVDSNGNVGIGFTSPDRLLQAASDINITSTLSSLTGAAGTQFAITGSTANNLNDKLVLGIDTTDHYGVIQAGNPTSAYNLALNPAGGNVGIGTTSPTANFNLQTTVTTTNGALINADYLSSGFAMSLASLSNSLSSGGLLSLDWSPGASTVGTGDLLSINMGANALGANLLNLKDNGSSIFSVSQTAFTTSLPSAFTAPGDVSIAYDLNFTNPTASFIKSAAPLYIQAGEVFNSSNLTLTTYNAGQIILDGAGGVYTTGNVGIGSSFTGSAIPAFGLAVQGNVGIGTTTVNSTLTVVGNAHIGGLNQTITAPANGLFVDGNVGIGATTSNNKLDVWGNANITGNLTVGGVITDGNNLTVSSGQFLAPNGTALLPSYSFTSSPSTGLWSPSANALSLTTNGSGTSGITITAGGNVGIGVTNPVGAFQVNGSAGIGYGSIPTSSFPTNGLAISGNLGLGTTSPAYALQAVNSGGVGVGGFAFDLTAGANVFRLQRNGTNQILADQAGGSIGFGSGGTSNRMFLDNVGNLGIGASAVSSKLGVGGNVGIGNVFGFKATPVNGLAVQGNVGIGTTTANSNLVVVGNAVVGNSFTGITAPTSGMFIEGNVGIGATTSSNKLDVWGNANITGNLTIGGTETATSINNGQFLAGNGTASAPGYAFTNSTSTGLWSPSANALSLTTNGSATSGITIGANGNVGIGITNPRGIFQAVAPNSPGLFVGSNGFVGIGTSSPTAILNVNGSIAIVGSIQSLSISANGSLTSQVTGNAFILSGAGANIAFTGAGLAQITTAADRDLALMPGGTGNVGIGNSNPGAGLSVAGNSTIGFGSATSIAGPANGLAVSGNLGIGTTTANNNLQVIGNGVFGADYGQYTAPANGLLIQGNVGIGVTTASQNLEVNGRIRMDTWTADGTTAVYYNSATGDIGVQASDARLKTNINAIQNPLDIIKGINGVTFNWLTDGAGADKTVGVIAQDVMKVMPELVYPISGPDGQTYYGVHYDKLAPVLVEGVKKQQDQINNLIAQVNNYNLSIDPNTGVLSLPESKLSKLTINGDTKVNGILETQNTTINSKALVYLDDNLGASSSLVEPTSHYLDISSSLKSLDDKQQVLSTQFASIETNIATQSAQLADLSDKLASLSARLTSDSSQRAQLATNSANIQPAISSEVTSPTASNSAEASPSSTINPQNSILNPPLSTVNNLNLTPPSVLLATASAQLINLNVTSDATISGQLTSYQTTIQDTFKSLGKSFLSDTTIAGNFNVDGTLSLTGDSINALTVLHIQNSPLAEKVDLFNGKVIIDKTGNLIAQKISTPEVVAGKLTISNSPIASSSAGLQPTIGSAALLAGQTEVAIFADQTDTNSKIFVTPRSSLSGQTLYVKQVVPQAGFVVGIDQAIGRDIDFDWWLIGTK